LILRTRPEGHNCPYELDLPSLFSYTLFTPLFLEGPNGSYKPGLPSLFFLSADTLFPPFQSLYKGPLRPPPEQCATHFSAGKLRIAHSDSRVNSYFILNLEFPTPCICPLSNSWPFYLIIMFTKGIYLVLVY